MVIIQNDGPRIVSTNYWESEEARAGKVLVSVNSGAFRILLPQALESWIAEMEAGRLCLVSRGPWPATGCPDAFEFLFDDGSRSPFAFHTSREALDRVPSTEGGPRACTVTTWAEGPRLAVEKPGQYRAVPRIPWLQP